MAEENSYMIPEELLLEEIVVRLPVKSVVRFKSVCKTWRSVFRSRPFIDLYRRRHSRDFPDDHLESTRKSDLIKMLILPPFPSKRSTKKWTRVTCSFGPLSNGIYCLTSHLYKVCRWGTGKKISTGKIALSNPATHDYKFTNPFPPDAYSDLASKTCRVTFGFGTTCFGDDDLDYKVVVLISSGLLHSSFASFVYSLQSGEWKKIVDYECGKRHAVAGRDHTKATKAFINEQGRVEYYPEIVPDLEVCPQRFFEGCWHWLA